MLIITAPTIRPITLIAGVICWSTLVLSAAASPQNILERLRPANGSKAEEPPVRVVSGTKVKRFERLTVPLGGAAHLGVPPAPHAGFYTYGYIMPQWHAVANMQGVGESEVAGTIAFQQLHYTNDIKVTINMTGLPAGKHALHIHTYGDLSDGCKATGGQFPNNFLGNVETKEDGSIASAFLGVYLTLFGFNGIVGRSVVIHERPIDLNTALNAEVFSSSLQSIPNALAYQNEENSVGPPIACGIVSIVSTVQPGMMMVMPEK